jgi:hypothetical protein
MPPLSESTEHKVRSINIDGTDYIISLKVGYDGVEYIGRLLFTDVTTQIFYQDHGGVPGTSVLDAVRRAKEFTDAELRQRCHRALSEKRRFGKLRRATDEMIEKIRQLNRVAVGLEKGTVERESGNKELDKVQAQLLEIVRKLRHHAGVEDELK